MLEDLQLVAITDTLLDSANLKDYEVYPITTGSMPYEVAQRNQAITDVIKNALDGRPVALQLSNNRHWILT